MAKLLAKVNNGTYEPEFRLTLVIPQLVIGFFGVYGFGVTASDTQKYGWFWPAFYEALEVANMVIATMVSGHVFRVEIFVFEHGSNSETCPRQKQIEKSLSKATESYS